MSDAYATHSREVIKRPSRLRHRIRATLRDAYLSTLDCVTPAPRAEFLRCLYCHFVFDDQRDTFVDMLNMIRRYGEFVDTDRAVAMAEGREPIDGHYFHLSFDDGFRNIVRNAAPILREFGIPAIFFVPSAVINATGDTVRDYSLQTTENPAVIEVATWDDLKRAQDYGITIGSHTRTHARLSTITDENRLTQEICGSKQEIEDRLGVACKYIAWPYGTQADISAIALDRIRDAGYAACFSAVRGDVTPGKSDLMQLPRHHFEMHWPLSHVSYFCKGN